MEKRELFAEKIKTFRKTRGLSQQQLAEGIGRSSETVGKIERALIFPSFETLESLSAALEVPMSAFFDLNENTKSDKFNKSLIEINSLALSLDEHGIKTVLELTKVIANNPVSQ